MPDPADLERRATFEFFNRENKEKNKKRLLDTILSDVGRGAGLVDTMGAARANVEASRARPGEEGQTLGRSSNPWMAGKDVGEGAAADRFTQGAQFGEQVPGLAVPVAAVVGGANELSKAVPGAQKAVGSFLNLVSPGSGDQFMPGEGTSKPSLRNVANLIAGAGYGSARALKEVPGAVAGAVSDLPWWKE